jgi:hypothetical protein
MAIRLPDHPSYSTDVLDVDAAVLDQLAARHVATGDGVAEMERFLFGAVPVAVFDDLFAEAGRIPLAAGRWLLHLSGYFGGRWLRGEIARAQPDAALISFSVAPTEEAFSGTMARARAALDVGAAGGTGAVTFAHESLFDAEPADEGGASVPGLADSFGYNAGYNLEILETPPEGVVPDPSFQVVLTGLLRCRYATPKLAVLAELEPVARSLQAGDGAYGELADAIAPIQEEAVARGRGVWSSGLSVQGFDQGAYDQLLDVSSSFLETVQATALTMCAAAATGDADRAAVGARAHAAMTVWLAAYMAGLLDGEGEIELPTFD